MKILFSGGGTLGSVVPLVAAWKGLKDAGFQGEILWVGTSYGPEVDFLKTLGIPYHAIPSGKLRRYFSIKNFFDPIFIFFGFLFSLVIILRAKPKLIISAGGFVSVPLVWAGWLLRVPSILHQEDSRAGLANKLMAPCAKRITVSFERSYKYFGPKKSVITGTPVRKDILFKDSRKAREYFHLAHDIPTLLILGGGTGANTLNEFVVASLEELVQFCQVIHVHGKGKLKYDIQHSRYRAYEFLNAEELKMAYAASDLVVSRAGMSTLAELAFLEKPTVLVPLPGTHQEENAYEFGRYNACEILNQKELDPKSFSEIIKDIILDKPFLHELSRNIAKVLPKNSNERMVEEIMKLL